MIGPEGRARRRVVVLAGPSGSGKSRLATRLQAEHGWPIVHLDDFYRPGDDPDLPCDPALGIVDWDDPRSWDDGAAVRALTELVETGSVRMPVYDLASSSITGDQQVVCGADDLVIAEGIFAAEIVEALRRSDVLLSAWCITHPPLVTFARRLLRDLAQRRKPPLVLLRRGVALLREEPAVIARQTALGAVRARPAQVESLLRRVSPTAISLHRQPSKGDV